MEFEESQEALSLFSVHPNSEEKVLPKTAKQDILSFLLAVINTLHSFLLYDLTAHLFPELPQVMKILVSFEYLLHTF